MMYKTVYKQEKGKANEPLCTKESFLVCVPERVIMVTTVVYDVHAETNLICGNIFYKGG